MNSEHKVTARWEDCSLSGMNHTLNIVEVDFEYYSCTPLGTTNKEVEDSWNNGGTHVGGSTLYEIQRLNDPLGILRIVNKRSPDWYREKAVCECGGDSIGSTHSDWCPKSYDCG